MTHILRHKIKNAGGVAIVAIVAALSGIVLAHSKGSDRWWTPELDATVAAPDNHKVLFENDEVRVLEVTVPPGTREPMHVHRYPAVIYVDSSTHLIEHLQDGSAHDLGLREPGAHWLPVSQGHAMENVGTAPLHAIRVELKKSRSS